MAELRSNPNFIKANQESELEFQKKLEEPVQKGTIYKIPVVFHVLHSEGVENVSDEQIHDILKAEKGKRERSKLIKKCN